MNDFRYYMISRNFYMVSFLFVSSVRTPEMLLDQVKKIKETASKMKEQV